MNDTTFEMAEKMREMCSLKTPAERFKMGCSMYSTSRYTERDSKIGFGKAGA